MVNKVESKAVKKQKLTTGPDICQLKEEGYRRTPQRQKVLDILKRHAGRYLDGEEIFRLARQEYPGIGMATVYRTLALLEKLNCLSVLPTTDNGNRYQLISGSDSNSKCRMICRKCGWAKDFPDQWRWQAELPPTNGFLIEEIGIYGICQECLAGNS